MTDTKDDAVLAVVQADRDAAWPFRPRCYTEQDREAWMEGRYDSAPGGPIQAFARHRLAALANIAAPSEERAREILREEHEKIGGVRSLAHMLDEYDEAAVRAIQRALATPPEPTRSEVVEECARAIEAAFAPIANAGYYAEIVRALAAADPAREGDAG